MNRIKLAALVAALVVPSAALAHPSFEAHGHDFVFAAPKAEDHAVADRERDEAVKQRLDRIERDRQSERDKPAEPPVKQ